MSGFQFESYTAYNPTFRPYFLLKTPGDFSLPDQSETPSILTMLPTVGAVDHPLRVIQNSFIVCCVGVSLTYQKSLMINARAYTRNQVYDLSVTQLKSIKRFDSVCVV